MDDNVGMDIQTDKDDLYLVSHIAQIENAKLSAIDAVTKLRPQSSSNSEDILKQIGLFDINFDGAFDSISDDESKDYSTSIKANNSNENSYENIKKYTNLNDITNIEIINLPKQVPDAFEIRKIGIVTSQIDSSIIVHSYDKSIPFDLGSIVCLDNRTIIGTITDVFGPITSHYYRINLIKLDESLEIIKGMDIYCDVTHSTLVTNEIDESDTSDCDNSSIKTSKSSITINYDKIYN